MEIKQISKLLAGRVDDVARMLLPNGKRDQNRWRAGNSHGDEGQSLSLELVGERAGLWIDYASGEGGDLIDLWAERFNGSIPDALRDIKSWLGITEPELVSPPKSYKRPPRPEVRRPKGAALEWLTETRKLSEGALAAYRVGANDREVYFPFMRGDELIMCKRRVIGEKDIRPTTAEQEPCLFGWQAIPDSARTAYIVEGELDAISLWQYGYPALSVPYGGGTGGKQQQWIDTEYDNLARFDRIVLVMDNDKPGQDAAEYIAKQLGIDRCYNVTLPLKDVNDCLVAGISQADISKAIGNPKNFDPRELRCATYYADAVVEQFYPPEGATPAILLPWEKTRDKVQLRPAELSLWAGMNGHGKSQIIGQVALDAIKQGKRVCIASMEMKPVMLLKRMTRQAAAVIGNIPSIPYIRAIQESFADNLWIFECTGTAKTDDLLRVFEYARKRYAIDLFIVDSLLKLGLGEDDYNGQKLTTERLCDFKNQHDCHVAMVVHSRKRQDEKEMIGKMDIRGSGAVSDLADSVFTVWRNKAKEEAIRTGKIEGDIDEYDAEKPDCLLGCDKQRNGEWEGRFALWFETHTWQYTETSSRRVRPYVQFSQEVRTA